MRTAIPLVTCCRITLRGSSGMRPLISPAVPAATAPKVNDKKLEALTKAAEPTPSAGKPKPAAEEKPVDLSKADKKLSSLLGKKP